jgi:hypothetical protein
VRHSGRQARMPMLLNPDETSGQASRSLLYNFENPKFTFFGQVIYVWSYSTCQTARANPDIFNYSNDCQSIALLFETPVPQPFFLLVGLACRLVEDGFLPISDLAHSDLLHLCTVPIEGQLL